MDSGSLAGLKALYSDARKRAGVAAGIGAYLYTALAPVVLPIGPNPRQVQAIRRQGKGDLLVLSAETEQWLRRGYEARMRTDAVIRDLGPMLAHGEPYAEMGQGETTDEAARPSEPSRRRRRRPRPATAHGDARRRRLRQPRARGTRGRVMSAGTPAAGRPGGRRRLPIGRARADRPGRAARPPARRAARRAAGRPRPHRGRDPRPGRAAAATRSARLSPHYHRRYGEDWREHFWRRQLRLAGLRFNHPELYGPSPCEPDAARPARSLPAPGGRAA